MGWVSSLEDNIERLNERIHRDEAARENREESLKTRKDAEAILTEVQEYLELATTPELDFAHEIKSRDMRIDSLQGDIEVEKREAKKLKYESDKCYVELQAAKREIAKLQKEKFKLKEDFERVARNDFGAAVDAFPSPGMLRKHKPNG